MRKIIISGRELACAAVVIGAVTFAHTASAQTTAGGTGSTVSCADAADRLSQDSIDQFLKSPDALLTNNQDGGLPLGNAARDLLVSSSDTLQDVLNLVGSANQRQSFALASALARAAFACAENQPEYAQKIQEGVASLGNDTVLQAFTIALGDIQTAALASAPSAGAPSVAGTPANGSGTKGVGGDESTPTTSGTYSFVQSSLRQSITTGTDVSPSGVGG